MSDPNVLNSNTEAESHAYQTAEGGESSMPHTHFSNMLDK